MPRHWNRPFVLLGLAVLLLGLVALVGGMLPNVDFRAGIPLAKQGEAQAAHSGGGAALGDSQTIGLGFRIVVTTLAALGAFALVLSIILKEYRRDLLVGVIAVGIVVGLLAAWNPQPGDGGARDLPAAHRAAALAHNLPPGGNSKGGIDPSQVVSSHIPLAISLLGAVVVVGLVGTSVYFVLRRRSGGAPENPYDDVARETGAALRAIRAEGAASNAIVMYYRRLVDIAERTSGVRYEGKMTPRELGGALTRLGFPAPAIGTLTDLFERVRYGEKSFDARQEASAQSALEAVVAYCDERSTTGAGRG